MLRSNRLPIQSNRLLLRSNLLPLRSNKLLLPNDPHQVKDKLQNQMKNALRKLKKTRMEPSSIPRNTTSRRSGRRWRKKWKPLRPKNKLHRSKIPPPLLSHVRATHEYINYVVTTSQSPTSSPQQARPTLTAAQRNASKIGPLKDVHPEAKVCLVTTKVTT